jgi:serine/threonine protein kinase
MKELSLNNCRLDGRYDITQCLGRGSYSEVFLARDFFASPNSPHSLVVIKALNVFLQGDPDLDLERTLVENFQNEAIALDRVRHPHIIHRLGHGTARDLNGAIFHYLALEYLPGGELAKLCRNKPLPFGEAYLFLEQICAGLAHAHSKGIIHRDIKPQNILLTADQKTARICDFGVAKIAAGDEPITRVGTNIYAPPEHNPLLAAQGNYTQKLTAAADIYSLAKLAYIMFTGESPRRFTGSQITALPQSVAGEPWADALLNVLRKATDPDPARRYQAIKEFWPALAGVSDSLESVTVVRAQSQANKPTEQRTGFIPAYVAPRPQNAAPLPSFVPGKPEFSSSGALNLAPAQLPAAKKPKIVVRMAQGIQNMAAGRHDRAAVEATRAVRPPEHSPGNARSARPKRKVLKRILLAAAALAVFSGILLGTHNFLRGRGISLGDFATTGSAGKTGITLTDINLRSEPDVNKTRIGMVPQNSRFRIVNSTDNWYEIDVIQYGRPKENPAAADRGWISRKTRDGEETVSLAR